MAQTELAFLAGAPAPVYTVDAYDPAVDLAATVAVAEPDGKRILLQVGGEWCSWCHAMKAFFHENEAVATLLQEHFLIMKVNYSEENQNAAFLANYPAIPGYPHLYVLGQDGALLHSQRTDELEEGKSYSEEVVTTFLAKWAP